MSYIFEIRDLLQGTSPSPQAKPAARRATLDSASDGAGSAYAANYATRDIKLKAAATIQQWVETDDLDSGETNADRLFAMMLGIADMNHDGDITPDEQGVLDVALNAAWDYLTSMDVAEEDASALLNDWDADAGDRVRELIASSLPDGDEAAAAELDNFAFGDKDQGAVFDAAYKMETAVRDGKKVRISKRVSGSVPLSSKQRLSIRKAQMKSHSASAQMARMKSMKVRARSGL